MLSSECGNEPGDSLRGNHKGCVCVCVSSSFFFFPGSFPHSLPIAPPSYSHRGPLSPAQTPRQMDLGTDEGTLAGAHIETEGNRDLGILGCPVVPFLTPFLVGEGSPTKIDYRKSALFTVSFFGDGSPTKIDESGKNGTNLL